MRENVRTLETGWLPLRDSYEESVLTWYEQVDNSFRRREQESRRPVVGPAVIVKTDGESPGTVYD